MVRERYSTFHVSKHMVERRIFLYHIVMVYFDELTKFKLNGEPTTVFPYGEGHINETYYVETAAGGRYILQKINNRIFKDVAALMRNIELVTEHIGRKVKAGGGGRRCLMLVRTTAGGTYLENTNGFFRVYDFIGEATAYQSAADPRLFYESAVAFGGFQNDLADFDASLLTETIPAFHNTVKRFTDFEKAVKTDAVGRLKEARAEVDFYLGRKEYCGQILSLLEKGKMPLRVTHNDTKLNNVMIDDATGKAAAVIDLDTVMPGSVCYDFGDSIRFGCSTAAEDEKDIGKVNFRHDLFQTYAEGYFHALKSLTDTEKANLAFGSILMTYECGMRFLADHLEGDIYFRVKREGHNLDRARTQMKLVADMEKVLPEMERIILKAAG